jgi:hypothetical protein
MGYALLRLEQTIASYTSGITDLVSDFAAGCAVGSLQTYLNAHYTVVITRGSALRGKAHYLLCYHFHHHPISSSHPQYLHSPCQLAN